MFQWESSRSMRTDMTKLVVAFRNFVHTPNKKFVKYILFH